MQGSGLCWFHGRQIHPGVSGYLVTQWRRRLSQGYNCEQPYPHFSFQCQSGSDFQLFPQSPLNFLCVTARAFVATR
jgi:hypothetical protein